MATVSIRGNARFFTVEYYEMQMPCLWVFDCRRGSMDGRDKAWARGEYKRVLGKVRKWMSKIIRWTIVFLFPPGGTYDDEM